MLKNEESKEIDLSKENVTSTLEPKKDPWHPEKERMKLAYWVLAGVITVFLLSFVANILTTLGLMDSKAAEGLIDLCKTSLIPIVTLILGYYFSKSI